MRYMEVRDGAIRRGVGETSDEMAHQELSTAQVGMKP